MIFRDRTSPNVDWNFLGTALVLAIIGCLIVYSATYYGDPSLTIFKRQILWVAIGLILMTIFMVVDYHVLFDIAPILYGLGIALLLYLMFWGKLTANVKSWIHIGPFQFQPSEFMKIFTALLLARFFDSTDRAYLDFRSFLIAMGIIGLPVGLIIIQPDFGTAASFFPLIAVAMFFGGIRPRIWVAMILIAAIALPLGWNFFLKPYQKERVRATRSHRPRSPSARAASTARASATARRPSWSSCRPGTPTSSLPSSARSGASSAW
jgi:rod shape determining protein RodA